MRAAFARLVPTLFLFDPDANLYNKMLAWNRLAENSLSSHDIFQVMEDIKKQLLAYYADPYNTSIREYYEKDNIWMTLHIERDEMKHSAFLKWLLGLALYQEGAPIYRFIALLSIKANEAIQMDEKIKTALLNQKLKILKCNVYTEKSISSFSNIRYNDRLDIYIDCSIDGINNCSKLEIIVENKVLTKEGKNKLSGISNPTSNEKDYESKSQTQCYYYACSVECGQRIDSKDTILQLFVYLSPFEDMPLDEHFIKITYQDIVDYVIEPYLKCNRINDYEKQTLNEYLRTLGGLNNKNNINMAYSSEEKEMLKEFFKRNGSLISAALDILENESQDVSEKADYSEMKEKIISITKTGRPRRYFSINNMGEYKMYEVVGEFVKYKLNNHVDLNDIEREIKDYTQEPNQTHVETDITKVFRYDKGTYEMEFNTIKYYVTKEWGMGIVGANFHGFMNKVNEQYSTCTKAFLIQEL